MYSIGEQFSVSKYNVCECGQGYSLSCSMVASNTTTESDESGYYWIVILYICKIKAIVTNNVYCLCFLDKISTGIVVIIVVIIVVLIIATIIVLMMIMLWSKKQKRKKQQSVKRYVAYVHMNNNNVILHNKQKYVKCQ